MNEETYAKVTGLAAEALNEVVREDWDAAQAAVRRVCDEGGFDGFFLLLTAAADWAIQAQAEVQGREAPKGPAEGRPAWIGEDGHLTLDADEVDAPDRWGAQFVAARAAMDHEMTLALAQALPDECGAHVLALLGSCAKWLQKAGRTA